MQHLWPALRAAVADTAQQHWHALRLIAPVIDPRTIAAESVASAATATIQQSSLWRLLHLAEALADQPQRATRIVAASGLSADDVVKLTRHLDALDRTSRAWTQHAYPTGAHNT